MSFTTSETGAVTVDWVVLTAALVGLGLATMSVVSQGVEDTATDIDTQLKADGIIKTAFGGPALASASYSYFDINNRNIIFNISLGANADAARIDTVMAEMDSRFNSNIGNEYTTKKHLDYIVAIEEYAAASDDPAVQAKAGQAQAYVDAFEAAHGAIQ